MGIFLESFAKLAGWQKLSQHYHCSNTDLKNMKMFKTIEMRQSKIRRCLYSNALSIGSDTKNLYFKVFPPFKFGHEPLRLPFEEMQIRKQKSRYLKMDYFYIQMQNAPSVEIIIANNFLKEITFFQKFHE